MSRKFEDYQEMSFVLTVLEKVLSNTGLANSYVNSEKNSGVNGIRTHDLCDTGAVLYQLSYQAN